MKIIPEFPRFAGIDLEMKEEIEAFTSLFTGHSDFNFVNLHSWNNDNKMAVSWLLGNLVFKFRDYISSQSFYTFIGSSELVMTAQVLLSEASKHGCSPQLKLVPEDCTNGLVESGLFRVLEDHDNHDYLLSISTLASIKGRKQAHTRELVNRFTRESGNEAIFYEIDLSKKEERRGLYAVFQAREGAKSHNDKINELKAFSRLLDHHEEFKLRTFGVNVSGTLRAFIICEVVNNGPVVAHFWKADTKFRGIYHYLLHNLSKELELHGHELLNFEQDLGIPGLRAAKQFLRPVGFLRKFSVELIHQLPALETESPKQLEQIRVGNVSREFAGTVDRVFR